MIENVHNKLKNILKIYFKETNPVVAENLEIINYTLDGHICIVDISYTEEGTKHTIEEKNKYLGYNFFCI